MRDYVSVQHCQHGIVIVKYNNPKSGNSLHPRLLAEMVEVMEWANQDPAIRVIVLTGEGKFFCTGMELVDRESMSFARGSHFHQLVRLFVVSEKILIAAVNGPAAGFGATSLALCDLVYAVPDAYFFTPFVKWGLTTEACSSFTFPSLMGHQKAALLCLAGDRITAQEASNCGLVGKILEKEHFLDDVVAIATRIAQSPPGSLRCTKRLMREPFLKQLLDANDRECDAFHNERIPSGEPDAAIKQFKISQAAKRAQRTESKL